MKETPMRTNKRNDTFKNTLEWKHNRFKTSSNTKQPFLSSCPQPATAATIKAFNQIIRQKHQKGLSGSSNSLLRITPHITTLRRAEKVLKENKSTIKHHLSVLPAKICAYEKGLKENNESSYFLSLAVKKYKRDGSWMILQSKGKYFTCFHNSASSPIEAGVTFKGWNIIVKDNAPLHRVQRRVERVEWKWEKQRRQARNSTWIICLKERVGGWGGLPLFYP